MVGEESSVPAVRESRFLLFHAVQFGAAARLLFEVFSECGLGILDIIGLSVGFVVYGYL